MRLAPSAPIPLVDRCGLIKEHLYRLGWRASRPAPRLESGAETANPAGADATAVLPRGSTGRWSHATGTSGQVMAANRTSTLFLEKARSGSLVSPGRLA